MRTEDWYYVDGNNNRVGPVKQESFEALVAQGELGSETLVWYEGIGDWKPYHEITGASPSSSAVALAASDSEDLSACSECGNVIPTSHLLKIRGSLVCAPCKPLLLRQSGGGSDRSASLDYAGFWIRFAAKFLDGLSILVISTLIGVVIVFLMGGATDPNSAPKPNDVPESFLVLAVGFYIGSILQLLIHPLYHSLLVWKYGATIGKMAMGLRVVTATGDEVGFLRALGRSLAEFLNIFTFMIGYMIAGIDSEKRALHDFACNTRVVRA